MKSRTFNKILSAILCIVTLFSFSITSSALSKSVLISEETDVYLQNLGATQNQLNIKERADYMYGLTWVCQKTVTAHAYTSYYTYYAGNTYHMPYGQGSTSYYIGYGVSPEDFLAAANDANSIFYNEKSYAGSWYSTYYITDCSGFVSWCWGLTEKQSTRSLGNYSTYVASVTTNNIKNHLQIGDALNRYDYHVVLVTDIKYDSYGNMTEIEITEQTIPDTKRTTYTPSELASEYSSYDGIYRYYGNVPEAPYSLNNKLEGVSPLYLGENFDAWIKQPATGNYLTDKGGYIVSAPGKFDETQRWHFIYNADDGSYSILNDVKNQWFDVPYGDYSDNNRIWLCDYNGLEPQRFYIYFTRGYFFFRTVGSKKVFDVNAYTNDLELCGEDTGTTDISFNARAFEILKFNNDYSHWCYNVGKTNSVFVRNSASGLLMTAEGSSVVFKEATYGDEQRWIIGRREDGSYEFKSVSTGLYLDVLYGELAAGTTVDLFQYNGLRPQSFYILPNSNWGGSYYIKPCYTHTVCYVDGNTHDMTLQDVSSEDWAVSGQTFEIVMDGIVNNTYAPTYLGDDFYGYLTGKASGNTLTDMGGSLLAQPTTYADNQLFHFVYDQNTLSYKIIGNSGKCIDVTYALHTDGSTIGMYDDNGWVAQKFRFYEINGYVYISPYYTNRLVDIHDGNKSTVQLYGNELSDFRAFTLKKAKPVSRKLIVKAESPLKIDNGKLFKVTIGQTAESVISQFENENVIISDSNGKELSLASKVGTGYTAKLIVDGKTVDSVQIVIIGDINGDCAVDGTDYLRIKSAFLQTLYLDEISLIAADVDGNRKIDTTDYLRVKGHFLGTFDLYAINEKGLTIENMEIVEGTSAKLNPIFEDEALDVEYFFTGNSISIDKSKNEIKALEADKTVIVSAKTAYHFVSFEVKTFKSPKKASVLDVNAFIGYPESDFFVSVENENFGGEFTYSYDETALKIDTSKNLIKALKAGEYKVTGKYKNFTFDFNVKCHNVDKTDVKYNNDKFAESAVARGEKWESEANSGKTTLFIGDSYFDDPFWTSFWNDDYFGLYDAQRLGICATTTYHWELYLTEGWLKNTKKIPKNIVMDMGTNNVLDESEGPDAEQIITSLQRMFTVMHERFPETKIYWLEITLRYPTFDRVLDWNEAIKKVNVEMKKWCAERDYITFVDTFGNVVSPEDIYGIGSWGGIDETHLSDKGYRVLVDSLMKTDIEILTKEISFKNTQNISDHTGVKELYYGGKALTDNYVLQGKVEISETLSNPHIHFHFGGGTEFDRFLIWDTDSNGSFDVRFLDQSSSHIYSKSNGKLSLEWKLVANDNDAYFFVKEGNEYKLTLVYTNFGSKNLIIGSEAANTVFSDLEIITEAHDTEKYIKAISEQSVSSAINAYGGRTDSARITSN